MSANNNFILMLKPLGDRVFVRPFARKEDVTASGIIVSAPTDPEKSSSEQGEVTAVGPGRDRDNGTRSSMDVKVGDRIYFHNGYSTEKIKLGGVEQLIIRMEDIVAIEVNE